MSRVNKRRRLGARRAIQDFLTMLAADLQRRELYWGVYPITYGRARLAWTNGALNADEW